MPVFPRHTTDDALGSTAFKVAYAYGLHRRELVMLEYIDFGLNLHVEWPSALTVSPFSKLRRSARNSST